MLGLSRFGYHVLNIKCQIKRGGTHVIWPYLLLRHQKEKEEKNTGSFKNPCQLSLLKSVYFRASFFRLRF